MSENVKNTHFNSIKVRLRQSKRIYSTAFCLFQFHKGSIKTRSFYRQNRHQYNKLMNAKLRKNNQIKCQCIITFFSHTYDNPFIYSCINKSKNY